MSTRSNIMLENPDGTFTSIYCHWDGYPDHNGRILNKFYDTKEKVEKLLALGDLSILAPKIDPDPTRPHDFDGEHQEDVCLAYGRDRGETAVSAKTGTFQELTDDTWCDYFYIFTRKGSWKFGRVGLVPSCFRSLKRWVQKHPEQN